STRYLCLEPRFLAVVFLARLGAEYRDALSGLIGSSGGHLRIVTARNSADDQTKNVAEAVKWLTPARHTLWRCTGPTRRWSPPPALSRKIERTAGRSAAEWAAMAPPRCRQFDLDQGRDWRQGPKRGLD